MTNLIITKKSSKPQLTNAQKTFNRLKNKVKSLQIQLEQAEENLDFLLEFNYTDIEPAKKALANTMTEFVKIVYLYYKKNKLFNKSDRRVLKDLLLMKIDDILALSNLNEEDEEIISILEDLEDTKKGSHSAVISEVINEFKSQMSDTFEDMGVNIDLTDIDSNDNEETIVRKLFEAISGAHKIQDPLKKNEKIKPKSKAQIQKEIKEKELEAIQKKGLGTIYKELAKAIHPDLEQDPVKKLEKEVVMKRLTTAYERGDLHELLTIELEWLNRSENGNQQNKLGDEQLKIYNSILKDQVVELETNLEFVFMNPRYLPLQPFISSGKLDHKALKKVYKSLKNDTENYLCFMYELNSPNVLVFIKQLIHHSRFQNF